ncbi:MAG TPA: four helix bundle protein [Acidimicrobiia bacterium]|nr:four helix bundle protein [Acidimicrobiia bacterium]
MQDFRKLQVWHDSVDLAADIYDATRLLPRSEQFGLRAQLRSASVSISSNIAEGCGRPTRRDMARFLGIGIGSACEVQAQLYILRRVEMLEDSVVDVLLVKTDTLKKRLISLYQRVNATRGPIPEEALSTDDVTHHSLPTT